MISERQTEHQKTNYCRLNLYHRTTISLEKKKRKYCKTGKKKAAACAVSGIPSSHLLGWLGRGRYRDDQPGLHGGVEVLGDRPVAGAGVVVVPLPERRHALPPRPHLLHSQHEENASASYGYQADQDEIVSRQRSKSHRWLVA